MKPPELLCMLHPVKSIAAISICFIFQHVLKAPAVETTTPFNKHLVFTNFTGPDEDEDGLPDDNRRPVLSTAYIPDHLGALSTLIDGIAQFTENGLHPTVSSQLAVTSAHFLPGDGEYHSTGSSRISCRDQLNICSIEFAECPGERLKFREIVEIGSLDHRADPDRDWAVVLLEEPSCFATDQRGRVITFGFSLQNLFLMPSATHRLGIHFCSYSHPTSTKYPHGTYLSHPVEQRHLCTNSGYVRSIKIPS